MNHDLCRLRPSRASFLQDMTEAEGRIMGEHATYWSGLLADGVAFGLVADPAGFWGLALVEAESGDEARRLADDDPVIRADAGFGYDVYLMPDAVARPASWALEPTPSREGRPSRA